MTTTLCATCGSDAVANVRGLWLCARCGLRHTTGAIGVGDPPTRQHRGSRRRTLLATLGSGLATKILIGTAAVAAVGGVIVTDTPLNAADSDAPPPATQQRSSVSVENDAVPPLPSQASDTAATTTPKDDIPPHTGAEGLIPVAGAQPSDVAEFVSSVDSWTECIRDEARLFAESRPIPREGFDPGVCGERPPPPTPEGAGPPENRGAAPRPTPPRGPRSN